jgi:acyl-CoA thioesterase-1
MTCSHDHNHEHLVLFHGDSITDAGRDWSKPDSMGVGYPMLAAAWFGALYPESEVKFVNRGISGFRACDLVNRWQEDCLDLEPTVVSILIGINDTWRRYDSDNPTSAESFEASYRDILVRTSENLDARIVLMEPFVLPHPGDRKAWREDLDPKIHVVRQLAREFEAALIPLDGLFAQASTRREPAYWAADGVHPTPAGHALIAQAWLETVAAAI